MINAGSNDQRVPSIQFLADSFAMTVGSILTSPRRDGGVEWRLATDDPPQDDQGHVRRDGCVAGFKKLIVVMEHNAKSGDPSSSGCTLPLTGKNVGYGDHRSRCLPARHRILSGSSWRRTDREGSLRRRRQYAS